MVGSPAASGSATRARSSSRPARRSRSVNASIQENVSRRARDPEPDARGANAREFDSVNAHNREANLEAGRVAALVQPMVELISALALATTLIVGGSMALHGTLSLGFLVSFTLYINRFFDPIRDTTQQYTNLQRATVAAERIFEILDTPQQVARRAGRLRRCRTCEGAVEFRDVRFGYVAGRRGAARLQLRHARRRARRRSSGQPAPARARSSACSPASTT